MVEFESLFSLLHPVWLRACQLINFSEARVLTSKQKTPLTASAYTPDLCEAQVTLEPPVP